MPLLYDVITYTRPDGVVINLSDAPYMIEGYDGFGIGEFQHTTVAPPGGHGEYWYDTRMEAKILTVMFAYHGEGVPERQDSRRAIVRLFNPLIGPGVLRLDQVNGVSLEIDCILAESLSLPSDDFLGVGGYRAVVRFKSHGIPAFRDPVINTLPMNAQPSTGNFTFPWSFPRVFAQSGFFNTSDINNIGDIETPVRITMTGPLIDPVFRNNTTGKALGFTGLTLVAGDGLVIDTDPANYVVQVNGIDAWQYLQSENTEFWDLAPGSNKVVFDVGGTNVVSTTGNISWYTRYLGQ